MLVSMQELKGKVAVVTGAASGIGRALADMFAGQGMRVVLSDVEEGPLQEATAALTDGGAEAIGVHADVSVAEQVEQLAVRSYEAFGAVHVLCNNAGVGAGGSASWALTMKDWQWVLGVNLYGVLHGIQSFVPRMIEGGEPGHILNTASLAGLTSPPFMAPYNVSKHAVVTLSESLHQELAMKGVDIRVSVVCPGFVKTRIADSGRNRPKGLAEASDDHAVNQLVSAAVHHGMDPSRVAELVLEGMREGKTYILTHPEMSENIQRRTERILEGHLPTDGRDFTFLPKK